MQPRDGVPVTVGGKVYLVPADSRLEPSTLNPGKLVYAQHGDTVRCLTSSGEFPLNAKMQQLVSQRIFHN